MSNTITNIIQTVKNWWLFLVAGILLIIASAWIFINPTVESYLNLAWLFSILVFINGISNTFFSLSNSNNLDGWGWYFAGGLFEIMVGIILISYPEITILTLPFIVGFWLLFKGVSIIGISLDLKKYGVLDWGWLMLSGVALTALALFMVLNPILGAFNIVYLTALSLLLYGIANIMLAFKLKKIKSKTIDVVEDFKNDLKAKADSLKEGVLQQVKDTSKEVKDEITKKFNEYKNIIDNNTQK
jgi:uncharacterized membrane protein HdeD (DUF308 family)